MKTNKTRGLGAIALALVAILGLSASASLAQWIPDQVEPGTTHEDASLVSLDLGGTSTTSLGYSAFLPMIVGQRSVFFQPGKYTLAQNGRRNHRRCPETKIIQVKYHTNFVHANDRPIEVVDLLPPYIEDFTHQFRLIIQLVEERLVSKQILQDVLEEFC